MKILVTGGAGFIGSNFIRLMLKDYGKSIQIHNLDALTYAGHVATTADFSHESNYFFHHIDITNKPILAKLFAQHSFQAIVHFAAESHVDRSIQDGSPFVLTNVLGTQNLLDLAKHHHVARFVHVSTDEVYGTLGATGKFTEDTPLQPNSPYSASKAASDLLVRAFFHTHNFPAMITRCSNNYGPFQLPEKLIPLMITRAQKDEKLPVYGNGKNVRDWIYVEDHARGVAAVLDKGRPGEVYNFGGNAECENLQVVRTILQHLGKPDSLIEFVTDRLGHDFRYAIDYSKATRELGWTPKVSFEEGIASTIEWYKANQTWVERVGA